MGRCCKRSKLRQIVCHDPCRLLATRSCKRTTLKQRPPASKRRDGRTSRATAQQAHRVQKGPAAARRGQSLGRSRLAGSRQRPSVSRAETGSVPGGGRVNENPLAIWAGKRQSNQHFSPTAVRCFDLRRKSGGGAGVPAADLVDLSFAPAMSAISRAATGRGAGPRQGLPA